MIIVGCAGGTDALSGTASFHSKCPVVSCPPDGQANWTTMTNPPGSSNGVCMSTSNVARFCAQVLSWYGGAVEGGNSLKEKLLKGNASKVAKLVEADEEELRIFGGGLI